MIGAANATQVLDSLVPQTDGPENRCLPDNPGGFRMEPDVVTLGKAAGDSKEGSLRWLEETYPGGQQCALSPTTTPWKKGFTRISWLAVRSHSKLKLAKLAW